MNRILTTSLGLLLFLTVSAQTPTEVVFNPTPNVGGARMCTNDAGNIQSFGPFIGQSNDVMGDTIFLCLGDSIFINHANDEILTGDPDMSTVAGVGYCFFDCPPTTSGPDVAAINSDVCVTNASNPTGFFVYTGDVLTGDVFFFNDGNLQASLNGGAPGVYHFAPITFDEIDGFTGLAGYEGTPAGDCVHLSEDEAFTVAYLNELTISSLNLSGCSGSFRASGGLSELDNSNYTVNVYLQSDPTVMAIINNGPYDHDDVVSFTAPQPGLYVIDLVDGKSCDASTTAMINTCEVLTLNFPLTNVLPGTNECLPVTVENFNNLVSAQFTVNWDPSILTVTGTQGYHPSITDLNASNFAYFPIAATLNPGELTFSWSTGLSATLADDEVYFEICFDVVGSLGDCTGFSIDIDSPPTPVEIINSASQEIALEFSPGVVCVSDDPFFSLLTQDSLSCPGFDDGSFTVLVDEGVAPYRFSWNTVPVSGPNTGPVIIGTDGESATVSNLPAGSYQVTITDASVPFLEVIDTIDVLVGPTLGIQITQTLPSCFGDSDGALVFTPTADAFPVPAPATGYSYTWTTVPNGVSLPGNVNFINDVPSGSYGIIVADPAGCTEPAIIPLGQPAPLRIANININITDASCTGGQDGQVTITADGGSTNMTNIYDYEWSTGLNIQATTSTITALNPGRYYVTVTDDNNCIKVDSFIVGAIKTLSIVGLPIDAACNGESTGNLLVTGSTSGAMAEIPYTFVWSANAPVPTTTQTTSELMNIPMGIYSVTMTDNSGVCEVENDFIVGEPNPLVASVLSFANETCTTGNDGSITLGVSGGTYPYNYTWSHDGLLTDSLAIGLSEGNYTVDITDANACPAQLMQMVSAPTPPLVTSFADDAVTCADDINGQLLVTVSPAPGTTITNYTWSTTENGATLNSINNLAPGEYIVTITADNACTTIDTAYVTSPDPITIQNIDITSPGCPGQETGRLNIFAVGGTGELTYTWSWIDTDGLPQTRTGSVLYGVPAGDYELNIIDENNCTAGPFIFTVSDPPSIVAAFNNVQDASCPDDATCDGQISVFANYSDGSMGDFIFTWASGEMTPNGNTSSAVQLCEGPQTVNINDGSCGVDVEFTINAPDPITALSSTNFVSCNGGMDGSISLTPSGGTSPYNYLWLESGDMTNGINNLTAGVYDVVISDANNCVLLQQVSVIEPNPLVLTIDNFQTTEFVTCAGDMDGNIVVITTGGNSTPNDPFSFNWADNNIDSPVNTNLAAGTYFVTVTDYKNCMDELVVSILEPDPIAFSLDPIEPPLCFGDATVITIDTVFGGANNPFEEYTFEIDNNGLNFPVLQAATVFAGDHTVSVQDVNGCSEEMMVSILSPGQINIDLPPSIVVELGDSTTQLLPIITPGGDYTYLWTPADYLSSDTIRNPLVFPAASLDYTLNIVNENGCTATESVFVELDANRKVYIPNIFSPNGDGYNDKFQIFTCLGVRQINAVRLFDRWGGILYEATDVAPSCLGVDLWDGSKNNETLPPGVYVYMIEVEFLDDVVLTYRGDVAIVR